MLTAPAPATPGTRAAWPTPRGPARHARQRHARARGARRCAAHDQLLRRLRLAELRRRRQLVLVRERPAPSRGRVRRARPRTKRRSCVWVRARHVACSAQAPGWRAAPVEVETVVVCRRGQRRLVSVEAAEASAEAEVVFTRELCGCCGKLGFGDAQLDDADALVAAASSGPHRGAQARAAHASTGAPRAQTKAQERDQRCERRGARASEGCALCAACHVSLEPWSPGVPCVVCYGGGTCSANRARPMWLVRTLSGRS